jgi:hypothetical protein
MFLFITLALMMKFIFDTQSMVNSVTLLLFWNPPICYAMRAQAYERDEYLLFPGRLIELASTATLSPYRLPPR